MQPGLKPPSLQMTRQAFSLERSAPDKASTEAPARIVQCLNMTIVSRWVFTSGAEGQVVQQVSNSCNVCS